MGDWCALRFTVSFETSSDHHGSNFRNSSGKWTNEYWCFHHFGFNYMSHSAQSSFYSANLDWDPSRLSPIFHFPPLLLSSLHPISPFVEKKEEGKKTFMSVTFLPSSIWSPLLFWSSQHNGFMPFWQLYSVSAQIYILLNKFVRDCWCLWSKCFWKSFSSDFFPVLHFKCMLQTGIFNSGAKKGNLSAAQAQMSSNKEGSCPGDKDNVI